MSAHRLLPLLLFISLALLPARVTAQDVTIYRCTNANGALALRDSPCLKGEKQDVRTMQRPRDPAAAQLHGTLGQGRRCDQAGGAGGPGRNEEGGAGSGAAAASLPEAFASLVSESEAGGVAPSKLILQSLTQAS